ncbi:MAG: 2-C-methyl-D-erythritol 4-phosphate cytidylyltransferase [Cocleimonas sp.]|jgi:2-C-methyl-D-erythritol 4-phosphate cytidylyltransferase
MINNKLSPVWVVIPAAGLGLRMQSDKPKQYLEIQQKTLIEHTLECFQRHEQIAGIVVVLNAEDEHWEPLNLKSKFESLYTVHGGSNRSDSVMQGLIYLDQIKKISQRSWVMVHDAARPCLSNIDLDSLLSLRETETIGGLLASPVRDTMKRVLVSKEIESPSQLNQLEVNKTVSHTEPRDNLWHALTPQMFRLNDLKHAIQKCKDEGIEITDESSAMEYIGEKPVIVECMHNNIKVTNPSDLALATFLLSQKTRSEIGKKNVKNW